MINGPSTYIFFSVIWNSKSVMMMMNQLINMNQISNIEKNVLIIIKHQWILIAHKKNKVFFYIRFSFLQIKWQWWQATGNLKIQNWFDLIWTLDTNTQREITKYWFQIFFYRKKNHMMMPDDRKFT